MDSTYSQKSITQPTDEDEITEEMDRQIPVYPYQEDENQP